MDQTLSVLEKLYEYRKHLLNRRFGPPVIVTLVLIAVILYVPAVGSATIAVLAAITGILLWQALYGFPWENRWINDLNRLIDDCDFEGAEALIKRRPPALTDATRIKLLLARHNLDDHKEDVFGAYSALQESQNFSLRSGEQTDFRISFAALLWHNGNYKGFMDLYASIDEKQITSNRKKQYSFLLLTALLHESDRDLASAIGTLERAVELAITSPQKIAALNNLARLEQIQGNLVNASSYLGRALNELKSNHNPYLYHTVVYNLVWNNTGLGNIDTAGRLLDEFYEKADKQNAGQLIEYFNLKIEFARETRNRNLLTDTYFQAEQKLKPKLFGDARLAYIIAELRMRFNDAYAFEEHLNQVTENMAALRALPPEKRFHAFNQIANTLSQYLKENSAATPRIHDLLNCAHKELLALETLVDVQLGRLPAVLPGARDFWHKRKIALLELGMFRTKGVSRAGMDAFFQRLTERRQIWQNKNNPQQEIEALLSGCEYYLLFGERLGKPFMQDFAELAQEWARQIDTLLSKAWPHPAVTVYAIGAGYFSWRILDDREKTARWIMNFEKTRLSTQHFATGLRQQFESAKRWLSTPVDWPVGRR